MQLRCPVCNEALQKTDRTACCINRHSFDYAKQGYLNLLLNAKGNHGDSPESVKARTAFLEKGYYEFLRQALKETISSLPHDALVDLGCGEGYYTSVLPATDKVGIDLAKAAIIHAAKHDKSTSYVIASIFHLPLFDECADIAVTCFAPPANEEIHRILKPKGHFIYITPGPMHLFEMKEAVYEKPYKNEIKDLDTQLTLVNTDIISSTFSISGADVTELFRMTPYAYRTEQNAADKLSAIAEMQLTAEFVIRIYQKS